MSSLVSIFQKEQLRHREGYNFLDVTQLVVVSKFELKHPGPWLPFLHVYPLYYIISTLNSQFLHKSKC